MAFHTAGLSFLLLVSPFQVRPDSSPLNHSIESPSLQVESSSDPYKAVENSNTAVCSLMVIKYKLGEIEKIREAYICEPSKLEQEAEEKSVGQCGKTAIAFQVGGKEHSKSLLDCKASRKHNESTKSQFCTTTSLQKRVSYGLNCDDS